MPEVVRQEECRESGDDQVVEEERPAGDEAGEIVERAADERRGAAGLAELGRAFGVGKCDEQEEQTGSEQDVGREPERPRRDDAEREVDGAGDLAVRDAEEVVRTQPPLQPRTLPRHRLRLRLRLARNASHFGRRRPGRRASRACPSEAVGGLLLLQVVLPTRPSRVFFIC